MTNQTFLKRAVLMASCLVALSATAADPDGVPSHTLNSIRKTVRSGDAVVMATVVTEATAEAGSKIRLKIDQALMGELPTELEVPAEGFYPGDLQKGTQWLIALRFNKAQQQWMCSGLYDLVLDGQIRDIPVSTYLARVGAETERVSAERARRGERAASQQEPQIPAAATTLVQPGT